MPCCRIRAYNVYAVAESRTVRTLAGGVESCPRSRSRNSRPVWGAIPTSSVVPGHHDIESSQNAPVLDWLSSMAMTRRSSSRGARGAEVLAASGLVDGKTVTTHWHDI